MKHAFLVAALVALAPAAALAQSERPFVGPQAGTQEFTLNGTGTTDNDIESGSFGITGSYGWYLNENLLLGVRQTVDWFGGSDEEDNTSASTRGAADWHFNAGSRFRPFLGVNVGYIYGDGVDDTWSAGPEVGIKYFVNDTTFVLAQSEYRFHFDSSDDIDDNFDDGSFVHTVGLGFTF